jgi:hypothetical protein
MESAGQRLLEATLESLKSFEGESIERLTRMEENLRLLRQDLIGDGQPGRIVRLETEVSQIRAEYQRQRGIFAAISFFISAGIAILSRLFHR